jgi:dihydroorotate dehydrogenase electron transfer subunit
MDDFERLGLPVALTTDDGSAGRQCQVTMALELAAAARAPDLICACGPPGMLRCVAQLAAARRIACQVSIESLMACGMGACLGCAVAGSDPEAPYRHVCREGPVFDATGLNWSPSAVDALG